MGPVFDVDVKVSGEDAVEGCGVLPASDVAGVL